MPLTTRTSVANDRPATFSVTVTETSLEECLSQTVSVLVVVEEREATLDGGAHSPKPDFATPTTVVWVDAVVEAGASRTFSAVVSSKSAARSSHCTPVAFVVRSAESGSLLTQIGRVCFPPVEPS